MPRKGDGPVSWTYIGKQQNIVICCLRIKIDRTDSTDKTLFKKKKKKKNKKSLCCVLSSLPTVCPVFDLIFEMNDVSERFEVSSCDELINRWLWIIKKSKQFEIWTVVSATYGWVGQLKVMLWIAISALVLRVLTMARSVAFVMSVDTNRATLGVRQIAIYFSSWCLSLRWMCTMGNCHLVRYIRDSFWWRRCLVPLEGADSSASAAC